MRIKTDKELYYINFVEVRTEEQKKLDDFIDDFTSRYSEFLNAGIDMRDEFEREWEVVLQGKQPFYIHQRYFTLDKDREVELHNRSGNKAVLHYIGIGEGDEGIYEMVDVHIDDKGEHILLEDDVVTSYGYPDSYYANGDDIDYLYPEADEDNDNDENE